MLPPYVQTEITGASSLRPLPIYIEQILDLIDRADHQRGEILLDRDKLRRLAERDGSYGGILAALNPARELH